MWEKRLLNDQNEWESISEAINESPVSPDNSEQSVSDAFQDMNDEQIVLLCHEGNSLAEEYLLNKYKNFVRSKARSYFLIGADHEDIVQEGMIGLYKIPAACCIQ